MATANRSKSKKSLKSQAKKGSPRKHLASHISPLIAAMSAVAAAVTWFVRTTYRDGREEVIEIEATMPEDAIVAAMTMEAMIFPDVAKIEVLDSNEKTAHVLVLGTVDESGQLQEVTTDDGKSAFAAQASAAGDLGGSLDDSLSDALAGDGDEDLGGDEDDLTGEGADKS